MLWSRRDVLQKAFGVGLRDPHDPLRRARRHRVIGQVQIAPRPGGDDVSGIFRIRRTAQQVIGVVEGDEAFRVLRGAEDLARVLDAHGLVTRPVQNQQRPLQPGNGGVKVDGRDIVQEPAPDGKGPPCQADLGLALLADLVERSAEIVDHVARVGRGADCHHRLDRGHFTCGRQHCGTAQAVPDQKRGCLAGLLQMPCGGDQVLDV